MSFGVPGCPHDCEVPCLGHRQALRKGTELPRLELEQPRRQPLGPAIRQEAANSAHETARVPKLDLGDEDLAVRKVRKASCVVRVQVSHHDPAHVIWGKAELLEPRADLLAWLNPLPYAEPEVRV